MKVIHICVFGEYILLSYLVSLFYIYFIITNILRGWKPAPRLRLRGVNMRNLSDKYEKIVAGKKCFNSRCHLFLWRFFVKIANMRFLSVFNRYFLTFKVKSVDNFCLCTGAISFKIVFKRFLLQRYIITRVAC